MKQSAECVVSLREYKLEAENSRWQANVKTELQIPSGQREWKQECGVPLMYSNACLGCQVAVDERLKRSQWTEES